MIYLYNLILFNPIYNALVYFYNVIPLHDIGISIIILTIALKALLHPLSSKALKGQKAMQELEPKLKELQKKYKDNKQELAKATMELYKSEKVSPFSSCLPLLIQFPFIIALYQAMRKVVASKGFEALYPFVKNPGTIDQMSFGILNLGVPNIGLAVLAGAAQFVQTKMLPTKKPPKSAGKGAKDEGQMAMVNKQMQYMMPVLTVFIGASIPAGLTLYWFLTTLLTILQQALIFKPQPATSTPIIPDAESGTTPTPVIPDAESEANGDPGSKKIIEAEVVEEAKEIAPTPVIPDAESGTTPTSVIPDEESGANGDPGSHELPKGK